MESQPGSTAKKKPNGGGIFGPLDRASEWIWPTLPPKPLKGPLKYCLDCGFVSPSKEYVPGDFLIMVVLWFFFLLPGLIYWAWRLNGRYWGCAKCRSKRIIPADAPAALAALKRTEPSTPSATAVGRFCTACGKPIAERNKFCGSCGEPV